jgi:hypothetical protein
VICPHGVGPAADDCLVDGLLERAGRLEALMAGLESSDVGLDRAALPGLRRGEP